jgi:hypothetical protein
LVGKPVRKVSLGRYRIRYKDSIKISRDRKVVLNGFFPDQEMNAPVAS